MALARLVLTDFRSYRDALLAPGPGLVVLTGENGAGKTNVLEAVSLLSPGPRPARRDAWPKWRGSGGAGGFAVAARLGEVEIGTGTDAVRARAAPGADQRRAGLGQFAVRMAVGALADPGDGPAVPRRRRRAPPLPRPAGAGARSPATPSTPPATKRRCGRATSCSPRTRRRDEAWLAALEARMAEHGAAIAAARARDRRRARPSGSPPRPKARSPAPASRSKAAASRSGRRASPPAAPATPPPAAPSPARTAPTSPSPISARASPPRSARPASRRRCCSASSSPMPTSSPSAPAAARSCSSTRSPPISTRCRRAALFERLAAAGGQVWMTGTERGAVRRNRRPAATLGLDASPTGRPRREARLKSGRFSLGFRPSVAYIIGMASIPQ